MKFHVMRAGELHRRDGRVLVQVALDVPYHEFVSYDSTLPPPTRNPNDGGHERRVRLTRSDGSVLETIAAIAFVSGIEPPAILGFSGISVADVPEGTEIEFLANATKAG